MDLLKLKGILLLGCFILPYRGFTQQRNIIKLNVGDCINCVSALDRILEKDSAVIFVVKGDYAPDSSDVLDRFNLVPYRKRFTWDTKLYDSLSREPESELIQFCGNSEVNRSGLRSLKFISVNCER